MVKVIIHIYEARKHFLLFCDHQDTESGSRSMAIGEAGPIFTQENIPESLWDNDI